MAQNEKNRMPSSGEGDIQNQDQASQHRQTDRENQNQQHQAPGMGQQNRTNGSNSKDRGISGMMSDMDDDSTASGTENKNDSLNRDRNR